MNSRKATLLSLVCTLKYMGDSQNTTNMHTCTLHLRQIVGNAIAQIDNLGTGAQCEQLTHDLSHTLPGATNQNQEKTGVIARLRLARLHAGLFLHCG